MRLLVNGGADLEATNSVRHMNVPARGFWTFETFMWCFFMLNLLRLSHGSIRIAGMFLLVALRLKLLYFVFLIFSPDTTTQAGLTALALARNKGYPEIVDLLTTH